MVHPRRINFPTSIRCLEVAPRRPSVLRSKHRPHSFAGRSWNPRSYSCKTLGSVSTNIILTYQTAWSFYKKMTSLSKWSSFLKQEFKRPVIFVLAAAADWSWSGVLFCFEPVPFTIEWRTHIQLMQFEKNIYKLTSYLCLRLSCHIEFTNEITTLRCVFKELTLLSTNKVSEQ